MECFDFASLQISFYLKALFVEIYANYDEKREGKVEDVVFDPIA